jgi:hypothetical protein
VKIEQLLDGIREMIDLYDDAAQHGAPTETLDSSYGSQPPGVAAWQVR